MTGYVPPGTLSFSAVLARLAEHWMPEAWKAAPARETAVLLGEDLRDFQRRSALRTGTLPDAIYARVRPMLADGRLPTLLHARVGPPRPIPPASWQGHGAGDLRALLDGTVSFTLDGGAVERGGVLVTEGALLALLDGRAVPMPVAAPVEPVQAPKSKRNPGGRPRSHDDVAFVIIAARIAFEGQHGNQARLMGAALDAYAATLPAGVEPPSEAWARRLVRKLWNGLGLERTDTRRQG